MGQGQVHDVKVMDLPARTVARGSCVEFIDSWPDASSDTPLLPENSPSVSLGFSAQ